MAKRVIIVHGWGGDSNCGWMKWLQAHLALRGVKVSAPEMPDKEHPKIDLWVSHLKKIVGVPDKDTYFVGHSIGCQTIIRYLESLPSSVKVGGAVFVGGFFALNYESKEEKEIATPWIKTKINFDKVNEKTNNFIAVFSDNDPYVPLENADLFKKNLGAKVIIEKNQGHFIENETNEIPIVLNELLKLMK